MSGLTPEHGPDDYLRGYERGKGDGAAEVRARVEAVLAGPDERQASVDPLDRLVYIANVRAALADPGED